MSVNDRKKHVLVLGAGNFGTCLSHVLAGSGHQVTVWSIVDEIVKGINNEHRNPLYLSEFKLSPQISAVRHVSKESFKTADAIVLAVPTQVLRTVITGMKGWADQGMHIICAAKGIEVSTLQLPLEIISEVWGEEVGSNTAFISGPSFAVEVIQNQPTAVSVAAKNAYFAQKTQGLFHQKTFRVYTSPDPVGLEIAGAVKNVIAIAAGATAGLGFENNSRAALVTRGLAEITRLGKMLGADPLTFTGLGGVGDLFLTCNSEKSRNFSVGFGWGRGELIDAIMKSMNSVAEGVTTAQAVKKLSAKLNVSTPICDEVYAVLYEGKPIKEALEALLTREPKPETD